MIIGVRDYLVWFGDQVTPCDYGVGIVLSQVRSTIQLRKLYGEIYSEIGACKYQLNSFMCHMGYENQQFNQKVRTPQC